ncbi:hypothetical protein CBR_g29970 [Chara braunii]|uniref:Uncharacterized protein n=1 Tax=Chara braunii TaxID=69332 RepID=A0A388LBN9_CHABU|nr:hypothetical protein CBR_g29970 [Chara braunii]|eukprot:GBG79706.1 hypothetical protein CBR_g29970 [Chara braunii]
MGPLKSHLIQQLHVEPERKFQVRDGFICPHLIFPAQAKAARDAIYSHKAVQFRFQVAQSGLPVNDKIKWIADLLGKIKPDRQLVHDHFLVEVDDPDCITVVALYPTNKHLVLRNRGLRFRGCPVQLSAWSLANPQSTDERREYLMSSNFWVEFRFAPLSVQGAILTDLENIAPVKGYITVLPQFLEKRDDHLLVAVEWDPEYPFPLNEEWRYSHGGKEHSVPVSHTQDPWCYACKHRGHLYTDEACPKNRDKTKIKGFVVPHLNDEEWWYPEDRELAGWMLRVYADGTPGKWIWQGKDKPTAFPSGARVQVAKDAKFKGKQEPAPDLQTISRPQPAPAKPRPVQPRPQQHYRPKPGPKGDRPSTSETRDLPVEGAPCKDRPPAHKDGWQKLPPPLQTTSIVHCKEIKSQVQKEEHAAPLNSSVQDQGSHVETGTTEGKKGTELDRKGGDKEQHKDGRQKLPPPLQTTSTNVHYKEIQSQAQKEEHAPPLNSTVPDHMGGQGSQVETGTIEGKKGTVLDRKGGDKEQPSVTGTTEGKKGTKQDWKGGDKEKHKDGRQKLHPPLQTASNMHSKEIKSQVQKEEHAPPLNSRVPDHMGGQGSQVETSEGKKGTILDRKGGDKEQPSVQQGAHRSDHNGVKGRGLCRMGDAAQTVLHSALAAQGEGRPDCKLPAHDPAPSRKAVLEPAPGADGASNRDGPSLSPPIGDNSDHKEGLGAQNRIQASEPRGDERPVPFSSQGAPGSDWKDHLAHSLVHSPDPPLTVIEAHHLAAKTGGHNAVTGPDGLINDSQALAPAHEPPQGHTGTRNRGNNDLPPSAQDAPYSDHKHQRLVTGSTRPQGKDWSLVPSQETADGQALVRTGGYNGLPPLENPDQIARPPLMQSESHHPQPNCGVPKARMNSDRPAQVGPEPVLPQQLTEGHALVLSKPITADHALPLVHDTVELQHDRGKPTPTSPQQMWLKANSLLNKIKGATFPLYRDTNADTDTWPGSDVCCGLNVAGESTIQNVGIPARVREVVSQITGEKKFIPVAQQSTTTPKPNAHRDRLHREEETEQPQRDEEHLPIAQRQISNAPWNTRLISTLTTVTVEPGRG